MVTHDIVRYHFDGNVLDSSINPNHGSVTGNEDYDPGIVGDAFNFDGSTRVISTSPLDFALTDKFSTSFWIKNSDSNGSYPRIISKEGTSGVDLGWMIFMQGGNIGSVMGKTFGSDSLYSQTNTIAYNDGFWHHVAMTYDGLGDVSGINWYVDGSPVSDSDIWNTATSSVTNSAELRISGNPQFVGQVDEVRIYNSELSEDQIFTLFER